jgi:hypothetical protein
MTYEQLKELLNSLDSDFAMTEEVYIVISQDQYKLNKATLITTIDEYGESQTTLDISK